MFQKIIFLLVAFLTLSGCLNNGPTQAAPSVDYFSKKKECSEWIAKQRAFYEAENQKNTKYLLADRSKPQEFNVSFLDSVCYSKAFNSCIAFVKKFNRVLPKKGDPLDKSEWILAVDLLTNEVIRSAIDNYAQDNESFLHARANIYENIDCVK